MISNKTYPETLEDGFRVIQVKPSNTNQALEIQNHVNQKEEVHPKLKGSLLSQGLAYILLQILRWLIIIAFAIGCVLFVKDAWEGYQANEASIKISREKVEYMEHPAVTMW